MYGPWIDELTAQLPAGGRVLDAGCGCGVPVARELAAAGYAVTGVDISDVQISRARELVPTATFVRADITELSWPPKSFDAIVALYSIIHVPLDKQPGVLSAFARWLTADGVLLLIAGKQAWTGSHAGWLGTQTEMWWSQADAETYRAWLTDAGYTVLEERFVPEADTGHTLFRACRGPGTVTDRRVGGAGLVGRRYWLGPDEVVVVTGWGPGARIRNVRIRYLRGLRAGTEVVRPFRGLRVAPPQQ